MGVAGAPANGDDACSRKEAGTASAAAAASATARAAKASPNRASAACISASMVARAGLVGSAMRARRVEEEEGGEPAGRSAAAAAAGAWEASRVRRADATPAALERGVNRKKREDEVESEGRGGGPAGSLS